MKIQKLGVGGMTKIIPGPLFCMILPCFCIASSVPVVRSGFSLGIDIAEMALMGSQNMFLLRIKKK